MLFGVQRGRAVLEVLPRPPATRLPKFGVRQMASVWRPAKAMKAPCTVQFFSPPPGDLLVTASYDRTAKVWSVIGGACVHTLKGHTAMVSSAQFNRLGDCIVTSSYDFTAKVWDTASGQCTVTFSGHRGNVVFAMFTADDEDVVTTSFDGTSRMWKVKTGQCIHTLKGHRKAVLKADIVPW